MIQTYQLLIKVKSWQLKQKNAMVDSVKHFFEVKEHFPYNKTPFRWILYIFSMKLQFAVSAECKTHSKEWCNNRDKSSTSGVQICRLTVIELHYCYCSTINMPCHLEFVPLCSSGSRHFMWSPKAKESGWTVGSLSLDWSLLCFIYHRLHENLSK